MDLEKLPWDEPWLMWAVVAAVAVLCVGLMLLVLIAVLRPRRKKRVSPAENLSLDLAALPMDGPPNSGPKLEYYGVPVRLAVLVLAPAGRGVEMPPENELPDLAEDLLPGLARLIESHRTVLRRWPQQLSSQGFTQSFFSHIPLPGDRGKGTPWCSAAGKFESGGRQFLAGLVCFSDAANSLSQIVVQHQGQWHDLLRVKG